MKVTLTLLTFFTTLAAYADLPIMMGASTLTDTQIVVLHEGKESLEVFAQPRTERARHVPKGFDTQTFPNSPVKLLHYHFTGLNVAEEYTLYVKTLEGKVLDERKFHLPPLEEKRVRFAVASCMDSGYKEQADMWESLLAKKPDVLFLIGDNVYANIGIPKGMGASPERLWETYTQTRKTLALFRAKTLVPIVAVWDDNDYGMNDGNRQFTHKEASTKIFYAFFGQMPLSPAFTEGPGISRLYRAFGHRFFVMDNRSLRSESNAKEETHWGLETEKWLFDALKTDKTPTWILSGDQIFGGYHPFESMERDHPASFKRLLSALHDSTAPAAFITGDRHLTELMKIPTKEAGFETFELTTSPIHAKTYPDPWKKTPNPRQMVGATGTLNFAVVDSTASAGSLKFRAAVYGPKGKTLYERELEVKR